MMMRLEKNTITPLLTAALKEDVGSRDVTTAALVLRTDQTRGDVVVREKGVVAGLPVAEWVFGLVDPKIRFKALVQDGQTVFPNKAVAFVEGPARGILAAERVALNLLGRLSGIATLTRAFVNQAKGTDAQILDTRKTTPGLRLLERYAVSAGGGVNHRMNLGAAVLIKDNHLRLVARRKPASTTFAAGKKTKIGPSAIEQAVALAREKTPKQMFIEVEVVSLKEFRQALAAQPNAILLDNMKLAEIQEGVRLCRAVGRSKSSGPRGRRVILEVSGGVTLNNVKAVAATGVDRISVGALTHSARSLNVALECMDR